MTKSTSLNYRRFEPYSEQREWLHSLSKKKVLFSGNRCGKTTIGSYEAALHLTGLYPHSWVGARFHHPVEWWVFGATSTIVRDTLQEELLGPIGELGRGWIPEDRLNIGCITYKEGIPAAVDRARVEHVSGGFSRIQFFSYDMGAGKFQGSNADGYTMDEEPPIEMYDECLIRAPAVGAHVHVVLTPLNGKTKFIKRILDDGSVIKFTMTVDDVDHVSQESIDEMRRVLSESEIQARLYGRIVE